MPNLKFTIYNLKSIFKKANVSIFKHLKFASFHFKFQIKNFKLSARVIILIILAVLGLGTYYLTHSKQAFAAPWASTMSDFLKRKQITLVNNSGQDFEANTTYQFTVNTRDLYNQNSLQADCDDLRVVYQPSTSSSTELARAYTVASGATNCSDSTATTISFPLQLAISNSSNDSNYYIYYGNSTTLAPSLSPLAAYNIGAKSATFVAPFNGSTTALAAGSGTPTTATGAIRYSGGKTALQFDGVNDYIPMANSNTKVSSSTNSTVEAWVYYNGQNGTIYSENTAGGGPPFYLYLASGKANFGILNNSTWYTASGTTSLTANRWHHLAGVLNSATGMTVYVNGSSDGTNTNKLPSDVTVARIWVGAHGTGAYFGGYIDEVRASDTARYSQNFTPQTSPFVRDSNTKLLLHFDENGDDPRNTGKAIDDSGNANHGTITGAKYVGGLVGVDGSADIGYDSRQSYGSHEGVFIEEGTTNKITNPSFEAGDFANNWTNGDSLTTVNLATSSSTFTAGMAKRNSGGPFAAGIMSQTNDSITYPIGTALNSQFYPNIDSNQGSVVFWITPEWNGNDNLTHSIITFGNNFNIYKDGGTNWLIFVYGGGNAHVSISSWTAGTTYLVTARWDQNVGLSGTNKLSLSVGTSHTFAASGTLQTPDASTTISGSNALIEGLTIYRRPLYEATTPSGINVGNGDEISQIYAAGVGKDPTLVTGSWDVVFDLPTNATVGALATGTGNAWSHPHSSNLLYTSTTNTGGFMMNGTYTSDGWADEGTPSVAALSTANKIFAGGYAVTSDAADEGINYQKALTANANYVIRAIGNSDGTCNPIIKVVRADNTTVITSLAGTTTSTRTSPDTYIFTFQAPATETSNFKLINTAASGTCSWHQVEVLSNGIANPSMEGTYTSGLAPNYTKNGTLATPVESSDTHSGTKAQEIDGGTGSVNHSIVTSGFGITNGMFYSTGGYMKRIAGSNSAFFRYSQTVLLRQDGVAYLGFGTTSSSYALLPMVGKAAATGNTSFYFYNLDSSTNLIVDDIYSVALSDVSLTVTPATEVNSRENGDRVDGRDTLTQTMSTLSTVEGRIKFKYTPRHSAADAVKFIETTGNYAYIGEWYANSSNYIRLYWSAANTITMAYSMNGTTGSGTWDATSFVGAGTSYNFQIDYAGSGTMTLKVDGVTKLTLSSLPARFGTAPTTAYWGSSQAGTQQGDAVFSSTVASSLITSSPYFKFGAKSAKIIGGETTDNFVTAINPGSTASHTLSAYVYNGTTGAVGGTVDATIAKLVWEGTAVTTTYTDTGGGWWRLSYTAATTNSTNLYGVQVLATKTIYVDGVQLEQITYTTGTQTPFATTYTDGSLGTGYSWNGTANNSTSTRTATSLIYSPTSNLSASAGTISFWVKRETTTTNHTILWDSSGSGGFFGRWKGDANGFQLYFNGSSIIATSAFTPKVWYHVIYTYSGSSATVYVNNTGTSGSFTSPNLASYLKIGDGTGGVSGSGSGYQANATISDLRIYDSALSVDEVADLYYAGLGSHSEQVIPSEKYTDGEPPVLNWHLDDPSASSGQVAPGTTVFDSSVFQNNGTLSGATYASDSATGKFSLKFDGSNDYVSKSYSDDPELNPGTDNMSVSLWFKHPGTISGTDTLLSRYSSGGYKIYMNSSGYICFGVDDDATWNPDFSACSTTSYADSKWHFVEAVKTASTTITLYIDGVQKAQTSLTSFASISGSSPTIYLGIDSDGTSNPWDGFIDEVKIYANNKTVSQIHADYLRGSTLKSASVSVNDQRNSALSNGLVGYWKMDESSGNAVDSSGNNNTGTWSGTGSHYPAGKFGNGGGFNGTDDYVTVTDSNSLEGMSGLTFSAWVYLNSSPTGHDYDIVYKKSSYLFRVSNGNILITAYTTTGNFTTAGTDVNMTSGSWYHITATYQNNRLRVFKNGVESVTYWETGSNIISGGGSINSNSNNIKISDTDFPGKIDDLRIYNRALSPAEVRQLYDYAPGPVAQWSFEDASGSTVADSSGNSNTGTFSGTGTHWTQGKIGKAGKFNGITYSDKVSTSFTPNATNSTWEAWVYPKTSGTPLSADGCLWGKEIKADASWIVFAGNTGGQAWNTSSPVTLNTWQHVTAIYTSDNIYFYKNGVLAATKGNAWSGGNTNNLTIGHGNCGDPYFNGSIDDVRIYNYARSAKQIIQDMQAGHPGVDAMGKMNLIYLKMDAGTGTIKNSGIGAVTSIGTLNDGAAWSQSGKFTKGVSLDGSNDDISIPDFSY